MVRTDSVRSPCGLLKGHNGARTVNIFINETIFINRTCIYLAGTVIEKTVDDGERRAYTDNRDGAELPRGGLIILVHSVNRYTKEVQFNIYMLFRGGYRILEKGGPKTCN